MVPAAIVRACDGSIQGTGATARAALRFSLSDARYGEERDDEETRHSGLTLAILIAIAVTTLTLAVVVGIAWRRHSVARLEHPASALQQKDPISGR